MKKILLVEDEAGIANAFKKQLTLIGGFDVTVAGGGKEGLKLLEEQDFDLVLLDLVMPDLDGVEVLRTIRAEGSKNKDLPVVILTNVTSEETKKGIEEYGIKEFIVKTEIEPEVLIEKINSYA